MKNIILFGGAFDPIHLGHLHMADAASKALDAEVIFIPAKISVWKNDSAPIEDKIRMIQLAIKDFNRENVFSVSRFEADSKDDINYSIDTVRHFKKIYPDANLYLLIGQDQVNSFEKWKNAQEISELVKIVYFGRLDNNSESENISRFNMKRIDGEINNISSTDIRELKSLDTTDSVINYIIDNKLYFMQNIRSRMCKDRYIHSISVGKLAYEIAKSNSVVDPKRALIAGLIHDCGKELSREVEKKIMVENYPEYLDMPSVIYHQFTGAYLAKKEFKIDDKDILQAINYHTTGNSNMSEIAIIIYCADKIEPTRRFDSRDLIDAMKKDLMSGFETVMRSNVEYYNVHKINYRNPLTVACLKQYFKDLL